MQIIMQSASGNGNFELSGSTTNLAAQWTFAAYGSAAVGRNAGASAPNGTGAFTVSSSGSASAVSAVPTVIGHDYSATLNVKSSATIHEVSTITIGENVTPVTLTSGSTTTTTPETKTWQAAGASFNIIVSAPGAGDKFYIDDVVLTDVGSYLSCSASVGVSMSASNGIGAVAGTASAYVHSGSAASVAWAAQSGYFVSSATIDGVSSSSSGTKVYSALNAEAAVVVTATKYTRDNLGASATLNIYIPSFAFAGAQRFGKFTYNAGKSDDTVKTDASGLLSQKVLNHLMLLDAAGFSYLIY